MSVASGVTPALRQAYLQAWYRVGEGRTAFDLPLGAPCPPLRALYETHGVACALFITACNPFSQRSAEAENRAAQARLRIALETRSPCVLPAAGGDRSGRWPTEASFLALGIERDGGLALGREFRQHAVLWAGEDAVTCLQWCDEQEKPRE